MEDRTADEMDCERKRQHSKESTPRSESLTVTTCSSCTSPRLANGLPVDFEGADNNENIHLKKQLNLWNGVTMIVGVIVGSGIFVTPVGVLKEIGSLGASLLVWVCCGLLSTIGAICYAELGTAIPESGGDYAYIKRAFGPLPAFLFLYVALFIIMPAGCAVTALTFAHYTISLTACDAENTPYLSQLTAISAVSFLTFVNCYNVKWATLVQDWFTSAKVIALIIIIFAGVFALIFDRESAAVQEFSDPWRGTIGDPAKIALSFYSGLFSFAGWNYLNFVTEELQNPYRNLPRAIYISLPSVTVIYVLTNVAYFAALTPTELVGKQVVAVSFADKMMGGFSWIMPLAVACSAFGSLNGTIFASSRLLFVGSRSGHMPSFFSMINVHYFTPIPALICLGLVSCAYSCVPSIKDLINYTVFNESLFVTFCVAGLLWLRYKEPDMERPIKVNILWPILFFVVCLFLVVMPVFDDLKTVGISVCITLSGIPVYFATIYWESKPKAYQAVIASFTKTLQIWFLCVEQEDFFQEKNKECTPSTSDESRTGK